MTRRAIWVGTMLLMLPGCLAQMLAERASTELGCPEEKIEIQRLGLGGYRARGCGQVTDYVCGNSACIGTPAPREARRVDRFEPLSRTGESVGRAPLGSRVVAGGPAAAAPSRCSVSEVLEMNRAGMSESAIDLACNKP